ncbi:MAG: hypothetical protein KF901_08220 [Myxococcales bacterium]|nr:hypothetical protein [Myxococcales bacterium]
MGEVETQACAQCGRVVPARTMVHGGNGLICASCEAAVELREVHSRSVTQAIAVPPLVAVLGLVTVCVPYVNLVVPFILGVVSMLAAFHALRLGVTGTPSDGVTQGVQVGLIVSGIVGGLIGLGLIGINLLGWAACARI